MDSDAEAIRQRMSEAREALTDKLDKLEHKVEGTYCDAKERVQSVQKKYTDTKESVSNAVNIRRHVDRHPWAMIAGAAAVGFAGTAFFKHRHNGNGHNGHNGEHAGGLLMYGSDYAPVRIVERPVPIAEEKPPWLPQATAAHERHDEHKDFPQTEPQHQVMAAEEQEEMEKPSRFGNITDTFHDEIQMLKGLALGALFGIVRDMAIRVAPPSINEPLEDAINKITLKMGGQPIRGRLLSEERFQRHHGSQPPMGSTASVEAMGTE